MKHFFSALALFCIFSLQSLLAQTNSVKKAEFFNDSSILDVKIVANTGKLFKKNKLGFSMPAKVVAKLADGTEVNDPIQLEVRGHMRHDYCYVPPLRVVFNLQKSSVLSSLKTLKLVNECRVSSMYDQYIFKEFLIYKMYNLFTDMSFRARLLNVTFEDSSGNKKPITVHAFLLEDIKDVAKRNDCSPWKKGKLNTESTNRNQMTLVAIFQYMIGNTDWAVPVNHNTKLISSLKDSLSRPFVVPYDFDYAGLVNTDYAVPDERVGIENVRERAYRGFPRTMDELNQVIDVFKNKKQEIYALINNFNLLTRNNRDEMTSYIDEFYKIISRQDDIKSAFIENARRE